MKRIWVSLIAAGLLTIAAIAPAAGQETITLDLEEVDGSGVEGSARLAAVDGQTGVEVLITAGLEDDAVHPVHIHEGTCDELGDVAYPLDDIVGGVSETEVDVELMDLMDGNHAINVHLSADEMAVHVACATIEEAGVGGPADDEDDAVADDDEDAVADDDDAVAEDDDDAATDDDEAVVDDSDDAVADDDEDAVDDADDAVDDEEATDDVGDAVEEDDAADDVEDEIVPAAGSVGGANSDTIALLVALMAGSVLGIGVLIRRQAGRILVRQ